MQEHKTNCVFLEINLCNIKLFVHTYIYLLLYVSYSWPKSPMGQIDWNFFREQIHLSQAVQNWNFFKHLIFFLLKFIFFFSKLDFLIISRVLQLVFNISSKYRENRHIFLGLNLETMHPSPHLPGPPSPLGKAPLFKLWCDVHQCIYHKKSVAKKLS